MVCCGIIACSRLEGSALLSVHESGEAKERCSIAGRVEAWSRKARLETLLLGRLMAISSPFCGAASAFIDSYAAPGQAQRNNGCFHATGLA